MNSDRAPLFDFSRDEVAEATGEYLLARCSGVEPRNPVAQFMADEGVTLRQLAVKFATPKDHEAAAGNPERLLVRALGSSAFAGAVATGVAKLAENAYSVASEFDPLLLKIQVGDFRAHSVATLSTGALEVVPENATLPSVFMSSSTALETASVAAYASRIHLSRQAVESDNVELLQAAARQLGSAAARAVGSVVVTKLQDTATLMSDGTAYWTTSNYVSSGSAPSVSTVSAASKMLRQMVDTNGNSIGAAGAILCVPPSLEMSAATLVAALAPALSLRLVTLSQLSSDTRWFLMADPLATPAFAMLQLAPVNRPPFTVEAGIRRATDPDGSVLVVRCDFAIARVSRAAVGNNGA